MDIIRKYLSIKMQSKVRCELNAQANCQMSSKCDFRPLKYLKIVLYKSYFSVYTTTCLKLHGKVLKMQ